MTLGLIRLTYFTKRSLLTFFLFGCNVQSVIFSSTPTSKYNNNNREALRFRFQGYTLWFELEQFPIEINSKEGGDLTVSDLDHIIALAASEKGLQPIPNPHVSLLYGMTQFDTEREVKSVFNGKLRDTLKIMKSYNGTNGLSSTLKFQNGRFGVAYDGLDGEVMVRVLNLFCSCNCSCEELFSDSNDCLKYVLLG